MRNFLWSLGGVLVGAIIVYFVAPSLLTDNLGAVSGPNQYWPWTFNDTVTFSSSVTSSGEARIAQLRRTGAVNTYATTTPIVATAAEICDKGMLIAQDWSGRASSTDTFTLPSAGNMFADCLTTNGDSFGPVLLYNAAAAASTTTITAGASTTLVGVDSNADVINGLNWAQMFFHRRSATEMVVDVREITDAD